MNILIFSSECDMHASAVAWALNGKQIPTKILDVENFPSESSLAITSNGVPGHTLSLWDQNTGHQFLSLYDVRAVWCRRMLHSAQDLNFNAVHPDDLNNVIPVCDRFISEVWHYLAEIMPDATWLNPLTAIGSASGKVRQLAVAQSVGLSIPDTIMGNDPVLLRAFCEKHGGTIIMKPFLTSVWREQGKRHALGTTQITSNDLISDMPIRLCPAIFQNRVKKKFEIRALVLGDQIFAAKLDSQSHEHTSLDWRRDVHKQTMNIEPHVLDPETRRKILAFMKKLGLEMGSLDFILDENDELVFLEVNEQGQFLFLEARCPELKLLAKVANFLAQKAGVQITSEWPTFASFQASESYTKTEEANKKYNSRNSKLVKYTLANAASAP